MMSYAPSPKVKAQAELEWRQRQRAKQVELRAMTVADFAARTKIEVPNDVGAEVSYVPFDVWPAQHPVLDTMEHERLAVFLKARQIGISWLVCLYAMRNCSLYPGYPVLCLSRGQLEANELVHRISFMYHQHADKRYLNRLIKDNTADLEWAGGSSVTSLAATKDAGRSLTAALAILDEWAFMQWPKETLAAVKPTIDAGGKLFIISSADGQGSEYHQHWIAAEAGANGYTAVFLPWQARPDRGLGWRDQKIVEANGDTASVLREYPENPLEAFINAAGLMYGEVWRETDNVTEAAEYVPDGGPIFWALDDGYSAGSATQTAGKDPRTGYYVADSHPRVIFLVQQRDDGRLCVFAEDYRCVMLSDQHIKDVLTWPYPAPDIVAHGPGAAEIRGRLFDASLMPHQSTADVEESIKEMRRAIGADVNGWRRILVHPRCVQLRAEMASYRNDPAVGKAIRPIKQFDHGPDALRGLIWILRHSA